MSDRFDGPPTPSSLPRLFRRPVQEEIGDYLETLLPASSRPRSGVLPGQTPVVTPAGRPTTIPWWLQTSPRITGGEISFDPMDLSTEAVAEMYRDDRTHVEIDTTEMLLNSVLEGDLEGVPCEECGESHLVGQVELEDGDPVRSRVDCLGCGWGRGSNRIEPVRRPR